MIMNAWRTTKRGNSLVKHQWIPSGLTVVGVLWLASTAVRAENWPQWRGPTDDGISKETNLPAEWSESKNILWKLKLPGQSGATPAVWNDRIFVTSQDGGDVILMCIGTDGKERWKGKLASGKALYMRDEGNLASPSPSIDGQHVYTFTGTGDFACFDFEGRELWNFNA